CRFFFFSSRRRHTRSKRDWSSDVCSSDLALSVITPARLVHLRTPAIMEISGSYIDWLANLKGFNSNQMMLELPRIAAVTGATNEIGRASCRERGEEWAGGG